MAFRVKWVFAVVVVYVGDSMSQQTRRGGMIQLTNNESQRPVFAASLPKLQSFHNTHVFFHSFSAGSLPVN